MTARLSRLLPGLRLGAEEGVGSAPAATVARPASLAVQLAAAAALGSSGTDEPAVLTALQALRGGEWLELGRVLGPVRRPLSVGSEHAPMPSESWALALTTAAVGSPGGVDADARAAPPTRAAGARRAAARSAGRARGRHAAGAVPGRPRAGDWLLAYLAAEPVQYVVVHEVDRLTRNRWDDAMVTAAVQAAGARLVGVTEDIDETPSGALVHGIRNSIAQSSSRNWRTRSSQAPAWRSQWIGNSDAARAWALTASTVSVLRTMSSWWR